MDMTLPREMLTYLLLLVLGAIVGATLWTAATGDPEARTMSDTVGGKWKCVPAGSFKGFETVDCVGMQTLSPNPDNGAVRAFVVGEKLVTFRVTRWGDTPADRVRPLEGSR